MTETIKLGEISVVLTQKNVKNVHLTVHPPDGRVSLVAPTGTRLEVLRAYAISKLSWIRSQQQTLNDQAREAQRRFVERESHYVWGRRYLLVIDYRDEKPSVVLKNKEIRLTVRQGATEQKRAEVMHGWYKTLLHTAVPPLIAKWEKKLGVTVAGYYLQRMKTKWGSCNHVAQSIRLNTELAKKPKDLLEYVVVHEMIHMIEPTHNEHFIDILNKAYPSWREARSELNDLPLSSETWNE